MSSENPMNAGRPSYEEVPPLVLPASRPTVPPASPKRSSASGLLGWFLAFLLLGFLGLCFLFCIGTMFLGFSGMSGMTADDIVMVREKHWGGSLSASDKVAIIPINGVLIDEMINPTLRMIDKAAKDSSVKAVVVRIDSPGGTITASDAIHKRLLELRSGNSIRFESSPKRLVVSMGAMAASGGYYIAMPAEFIFAEKTTITGSIGVYASLLNVHKLAQDHGVKMELIKAGDMKSSGSMFHELLPQERQVWQDMVDNAYAQFLSVVEAGRPHLKGQLTRKLDRVDADGKPLPDEAPVYDEKGNRIIGKTVPYERKLADGGIFTAAQAKYYKLIDEIGYLDDAARKAASLAGLADYRIVLYERQPNLLDLLTGGLAESSPSSELIRWATAAKPRLWYLVPNAEFAALAAQVRP